MDLSKTKKGEETEELVHVKILPLVSKKGFFHLCYDLQVVVLG